jgi:transposase
MDDDTTSVTAALFGLAGFEILAAADAGGELELLVQTTADLVGCPVCGAVARAKDRRPTWVRDLPLAGRPVVLCWVKRIWSCPQPLCEQRTWTERHAAIAPRAGMTERARGSAFEQVAAADAAVSRVAAVLGVAWWTVMRQVIDRGTPLIEDPDRLDGVNALGVDETAYLRASARRSTTFATGIADLTPGRPARLLEVIEGRSGTATRKRVTSADSAPPMTVPPLPPRRKNSNATGGLTLSRAAHSPQPTTQIRKMTVRIAGPKSRARSDLACAGYRPAGSARMYQPRSTPPR